MGFGEDRAEVELAATPVAARRARTVVDRVAAGLPGDLRFRARVAASELVANSVACAATSRGQRVRLVVSRTRAGLRVELRDGGEPFDREARVVSYRATSGRGLRLVEALVDRWGSDPADGNLVWFEVDQLAGGDESAGATPAARARGGRPGRVRSEPDARAEPSVAAAAVLARAGQCIREGWCQDTDAVDAAGVPVQPWDEDATAWSLLGALVAALDGSRAVAGGDVPPPALSAAMLALGELIEEPSLAGWNDAPARRQQQVIDVLERARMLLLSGRVTV